MSNIKVFDVDCVTLEPIMDMVNESLLRLYQLSSVAEEREALKDLVARLQQAGQVSARLAAEIISAGGMVAGVRDIAGTAKHQAIDRAVRAVLSYAEACRHDGRDAMIPLDVWI